MDIFFRHDDHQVVLHDHKTYTDQYFVYLNNYISIPDVNVTVTFTYTEKYPDEAPVMEILDSENLDDEQLRILSDLLNDEVMSLKERVRSSFGRHHSPLESEVS